MSEKPPWVSMWAAGVEPSTPLQDELFRVATQYWVLKLSDEERTARNQRRDDDVKRDGVVNLDVGGRFRCRGNVALVQKPAGCDLLLYDVQQQRILKTYPYPAG